MYPLFCVVALLQNMLKVQILCIRQNKLGLLNHENYEYFYAIKVYNKKFKFKENIYQKESQCCECLSRLVTLKLLIG